jgi:hypothetical protein
MRRPDFADYLEGFRRAGGNWTDPQVRAMYNREFPPTLDDDTDAEPEPPKRPFPKIEVSRSTPLREAVAAVARVADAAYRKAMAEREERGAEPLTRQEWDEKLGEDLASFGDDDEARMEYINEAVLADAKPGDLGKAIAFVRDGQQATRDAVARVDADPTLRRMVGGIVPDSRSARIIQEAVARGLGELKPSDLDGPGLPEKFRDDIVDAAAQADPAGFADAHLAGELPDAALNTAIRRQGERERKRAAAHEVAPEIADAPVETLDAVLKAQEAADRNQAKVPPVTGEAAVWEDPTSKAAIDFMRADIERMDREAAAKTPEPATPDYRNYFVPKER